jgi:NADH:ubiquinone oxidoreductase subunit 4 (subunit M)
MIWGGVKWRPISLIEFFLYLNLGSVSTLTKQVIIYFSKNEKFKKN